MDTWPLGQGGLGVGRENVALLRISRPILSIFYRVAASIFKIIKSVYNKEV